MPIRARRRAAIAVRRPRGRGKCRSGGMPRIRFGSGQRLSHVAAGSPERDAIEVAGHVEHVGDELEVQVRPPAAVDLRGPDFGRSVPAATGASDGQAVERTTRSRWP